MTRILKQRLILTALLSSLLLWPHAVNLSSAEPVHGSTITELSLGGRPELVLQTGHASRVTCAVFAPDGSWLASGGADNAIKIWDVGGHELRTLSGHTGWIKSLAISHDGKWLASGSNDRTIRIWNVSTGSELHRFVGHSAAIETLVFSPDDRWLASGSADRTVKVWEIASGKERQSLSGHDGWVTSLSFSHDGKLLASASADKTIKLWETATWRELRTLRKHTSAVTVVTFSADDRWLASGSKDGAVSLWQSGTNRERLITKPMPLNAVITKDSPTAILALTFASSNSLVAAVADGAVRNWNVSSGKEGPTLAKAALENRFVFATFSANAVAGTHGLRLAQSIGGRTLEIRNVGGAGIRHTLESHATGLYALATSRDGKWLASGNDDRTIRLWDIATGRELRGLAGHTGWVSTIDFSPDSQYLASGSISGEVKVWEMTTGREVFNLPAGRGSINAVAFAPDGKSLAIADQQTLQVRDLAKKDARTLSGHAGEVTTLDFSPDGRLLASGGSDKTIRLWDLVNSNSDQVLATREAQANAVAFSPNGKWLAAASGDRTVDLWEVNTGRVVGSRAQLTQKDEVLAVAFSPDSRCLVLGGANGGSLLDIESGQIVGTLTAASGGINSLSFSNNGRWIVSGSEEGGITLWNFSTRAMVATLVSMRDTDNWLLVTPDGLFDGSPAAWNLILWRFSSDTFNFLQVEAFFNEYYYPDLLADIFAGKQPHALKDISQKDRRQPRVQLALADSASLSSGAPAGRAVKLKISVSESAGDKEQGTGSGAKDIRLFRNGSLVRVWHGDVLSGVSNANLEVTVPLVAGENRLTAYAFNHDNIKSADATLSITGAENLRRAGTAHILAVGVNEYTNPQYNLRYAAADARAFADELQLRQTGLRQFAQVQITTLFNAQATKKGVLDALAGLVSQVQPEDALIVYFAGHGTAQQNRFYLLPHDIGYTGARAKMDQVGLETILKHSISDLDLEQAFERIDAGNLLLIIDTCNSGQALEAAEKRRGPMNSKGLAQLAYEKGMHVLTAAQSYQAAREASRLGHGYLTFALVEEGLKTAAADNSPRDGQVTLREWLDYATQRVPRMQQEALQQARDLEHSIVFVEGDEDIKDPIKRSLQQPRVFYRREIENEPLVVSKP